MNFFVEWFSGPAVGPAISSSSSAPSFATPKPPTVTPALLKPKPVEEIYAGKQCQRPIPDFRKELSPVGGACTVAYNASGTFPGKAIGVVIAANNGLPGGVLGLPGRECAVSENDLDGVPDEFVLVAAVLANCGCDAEAQKKFYYETIFGKWGLVDADGSNPATRLMTHQGVNYVETTDAEEYARTYVHKGAKLTNVVSSSHRLKRIAPGTEFPVTFVFVGGPNTMDGWDPDSFQSRTKNAKATTDYGFFKACQTCAIRAAVDSAAEAGVEVLVMAPISTGIRCRFSDFCTLFTAVLNEPVGPRGEKRGQYFVDIVLPEVGAGQTRDFQSFFSE